MSPKKQTPVSTSAGPRKPVAGGCSDGAEISALIADLATKDAVRRKKARTRLVALGKPAVPQLIQCLADRRPHVRWEAAKTLGAIADPAAAGVLLRSFDDKDTDVRWLAAMGLAALGIEGLRPLLLALEDRPDSLWLREGAHHVCHELIRQSSSLAELVRPLQAALDRPEPKTVVPLAAYAVLAELNKRFPPGRRAPAAARIRRT